MKSCVVLWLNAASRCLTCQKQDRHGNVDNSIAFNYKMGNNYTFTKERLNNTYNLKIIETSEVGFYLLRWGK